MKLPEQTRDTFRTTSSPHDDDDEGVGLEPATNYLYRVRAIHNDGEPGEWSSPEPNVPATTLDFETTYAWTPDEQMHLRDSTGWEGHCLVHRIEALRLSKSGTQVKLTLRAASDRPASIERIFISRAHPDPGRDLYDPDVDLTPVLLTPLVVPANNAVTLDAVPYRLDAEQALLIAVDFSPAPPASGTRATDSDRITVPVEEARVFFKQALGEAANPDRSDFALAAGIHLIEKIEVG
jgi:hypothetical protein